MSVIAGVNQNSRAAKDASQAGLAALAYGVSVTLPVTSTSGNIALPVDANGNLYPAYAFISTVACWIAFCTTNTDVAVVGAANNYLMPGAGCLQTLITTPQQQLNKTVGGYLAAVSATAGNLCITGIF